MKNKYDIPEYLLQKIRRVNGLEENDTSKDNEFNNKSVDENFADIIQWEFGDRRWGEVILKWINELKTKPIR